MKRLEGRWIPGHSFRRTGETTIGGQKSGRDDEFERIAMPQARSLLRVARRLTADPATAEDLVQETLLLAWRGFDRFETDSNVRAWLFKILMNAYYGRGRKTRTSPELVPIAANDGTPPIEFRSETPVLTGLEVSEALAALPVEQRTVLMLGVVEGFTCQELSRILSIPIGTVMSRLSRARQALRTHLSIGRPERAKCATKESI